MAKDILSSDNTTMYRIGDFARYLGVTPDFLKHYENLGIISSVQGENGYRYFRFQEANKIFECIKLKNLGFTIRESEKMLNELSEAEIFGLIGENLLRIRKDIHFKQQLLSSYSRFEEEMSFLAYADSDWSIRNTEPILFLPHTTSRSFIDSPKIYEILPEWMGAMPIVRSAAIIPVNRPESFSAPTSSIRRTWGFAVPKRYAEALELPINDMVIQLPACKALHYVFSARIAPDRDLPVHYYSMWKKLDELGLSPKGSILAINNIARIPRGSSELTSTILRLLKHTEQLQTQKTSAPCGTPVFY